MTTSRRNALNIIRIVGGAVAFAAIVWVFLDPAIRKPLDARELLFVVFGVPAGAAALALQIDRKSQI